MSIQTLPVHLGLKRSHPAFHVVAYRTARFVARDTPRPLRPDHLRSGRNYLAVESTIKSKSVKAGEYEAPRHRGPISRNLWYDSAGQGVLAEKSVVT